MSNSHPNTCIECGRKDKSAPCSTCIGSEQLANAAYEQGKEAGRREELEAIHGEVFKYSLVGGAEYQGLQQRIKLWIGRRLAALDSGKKR